MRIRVCAIFSLVSSSEHPPSLRAHSGATYVLAPRARVSLPRFALLTFAIDVLVRTLAAVDGI